MPLALPASPRPSPPVSMCDAGGGLCFVLAGAAPGVRLPAARVPRKPPLGRWRGLPCPPYADGLRGLWGLSPPDRLGKNRGSLRSHVNQISGRLCPPLPLVDSPAFVNSPPKLPTANATKPSVILLRSVCSTVCSLPDGSLLPQWPIPSFGQSSHLLTDTKTDRGNGKIGNLPIFFFTFFNFAIE